MIATFSPCQACGWEFYGFGYAGEPCSAECDEALRSAEDDVELVTDDD